MPPDGGEPVAVAVVERRVGPGVEWASGAVESARRTAVSSRILARIEEIRVTAGSEVAEGDVLIGLDARDLDARSGEAAEALRGARARLALARTEQERMAKLVAQGVEAQQRLDRQRAISGWRGPRWTGWRRASGSRARGSRSPRSARR